MDCSLIAMRNTSGKSFMQIRSLLYNYPADRQTKQHDQDV